MSEKEEYYIIEDNYDPQSRIDEMEKLEPEFWKKKSLDEMNQDEWEALCDGCGKCCLNKIEVIEGKKSRIAFTNVACRFFCKETCLCKIYENRFEQVYDCRQITIDAVREKPRWLPKTCAYWLLDNGYDLPDCHPLITKSASSIHEENISLKNREIETESLVIDYANHIVDWEDL